MIKVEKDFRNIPKILTSDNRKIAFDNNILASQYIDKKHLYKVGSVQNKLNEIYNLKCAYCEKNLLDAPKHLEHYRPMDNKFYAFRYFILNNIEIFFTDELLQKVIKKIIERANP